MGCKKKNIKNRDFSSLSKGIAAHKWIEMKLMMGFYWFVSLGCQIHSGYIFQKMRNKTEGKTGYVLSRNGLV
jgi:hypothetical protein